MLSSATIENVLALQDSEIGGDSALDGFEFQVSAAIYLIFEELKNSNQFKLYYEKLEDFIIFTDKINLYQAKSISQNLTPIVLYKPNKKLKKEKSTLSIIEKMNENYLTVKEAVKGCEVNNTLIICENQIFSSKLSSIDKIKDEKYINFNNLKTEVKNEIISNTKFSEYTWNDIKARRLIPKPRHEEVTRSYIEDVIHVVLGEGKVSSIAMYNSLTCEIRKIRKQRKALSEKFILGEIKKYASFDTELKFEDYTFLLNDTDKRNIKMMSNFNTYKDYINLRNHPAQHDFEIINLLVKKREFDNIDNFYRYITNTSKYCDIYTRLNEYELKALILLCIIKETK